MTSPVSYWIDGKVTVVPLRMDAEDSFFVVFRKQAIRPSMHLPESTLRDVATLGGPWDVTFEPDRGAPVGVTLPALAPLNEQTDAGIRYFSGVASYKKTLTVPARQRPGAPLLIDLGAVGDMAEVWLNGRKIGTVWHAPFRTDIGPAMRRGKNHLEVRVADLWVNRLIGDAQPGATRVGFTVMPTYKPDAPLRPAGLIGPVRLMSPMSRAEVAIREAPSRSSN